MSKMKIDIRKKLKPLLKYPGGKTDELDVILKNSPQKINNYIEPFVGGGAVLFSINANKYFINDISEELILLYEYVKSNNSIFFEELNIIIENWDKLTSLANWELVDLFIEHREGEINLDRINPVIRSVCLNVPMFNIRKREVFEGYLKKCLEAKFRLIKKNEVKKKQQLCREELRQNLEAGIKAAYYTYLRDLYNNPEEYDCLEKQRKVAIYFFIREYCFSSMFRFNRSGGFNVPYGGISYNKKSLAIKRDYFKSIELRKHLAATGIFNKDFYEFLEQIKIDKDDFMFLDPPYDTTFSEYDKNKFEENDQKRLANYLISKCPCNFMLVIKKTNFIHSLYNNQKNIYIKENTKTYFVSFMGRGEKEAKQVTHLVITNYLCKENT